MRRHVASSFWRVTAWRAASCSAAASRSRARRSACSCLARARPARGRDARRASAARNAASATPPPVPKLAIVAQGVLLLSPLGAQPTTPRNCLTSGSIDAAEGRFASSFGRRSVAPPLKRASWQRPRPSKEAACRSPAGAASTWSRRTPCCLLEGVELVGLGERGRGLREHLSARDAASLSRSPCSCCLVLVDAISSSL
mgnify:CR=1 FL=1